MNYIIDNPGILLLSGIIAMIFVFIRDRWVSNQAVGNDKMKIIADNISAGAMSFLNDIVPGGQILKISKNELHL